MTTQPEALLLAEVMSLAFPGNLGIDKAAAELRRQHGEIKSMRAERLRSERRLLDVKAQRDALLEALKTYGWHTKDCPQYPTYARPKNWPACTCGFDAAIKAVEENT